MTGRNVIKSGDVVRHQIRCNVETFIGEAGIQDGTPVNAVSATETLTISGVVIDGETVAEVLDYVQYNSKKMVRTVESWVTTSVKGGIITLEEGKEFLSNYRSGLYGYTYLE